MIFWYSLDNERIITERKPTMAYMRRFSDDDVKRMEQDADAAGRITAAERKMALAGNSFNNRNNQIADLAAAAHERHMASRARFIEGNQNAVSPQERAGVMQWQHNQGLTGRERAIQDFERGMARDRIKGDVAVAREKRLGMKEQGSDAATVTANATIEGNRSRFGYFDKDGTYHPGSDVKSAEANMFHPQMSMARIYRRRALTVSAVSPSS